MREALYLTLSLWLGIIGALIGMTGMALEFTGSYVKTLGERIIDHSFKYDLYL